MLVVWQFLVSTISCGAIYPAAISLAENLFILDLDPLDPLEFLDLLVSREQIKGLALWEGCLSHQHHRSGRVFVSP